MPIQLKPNSLTIQATKTVSLSEPIGAQEARQMLRDIATHLTSGDSVKSGYLRLDVAKGAPILSRGGGHVRSGYSAARSLVEQLVRSAYGDDSPAATSLQTYLNGRTKVGTRGLVKLVAVMESDSAPGLARFRDLKRTQLQAPLGAAGLAPAGHAAPQVRQAQQAAQQQRLMQAQLDLERSMEPVSTPLRYRAYASRMEDPTRQLDRFQQAMDTINQNRQLRQERLDLCRAALAAGAIDPFARLEQSDAAFIERAVFDRDPEARRAQRDQIQQGMQANLGPAEIAEQLQLPTDLVADQMLDIQLHQHWDKADQLGFVVRLLQEATGDVEDTLRPQAVEVESLLTEDHLLWYRQLLDHGMPAEQVKGITPLVLQRLAERHADHDPLLAREWPADPEQAKARMRQELIEEQAELIVTAKITDRGGYGQALMQTRSEWLSLARQTPQSRKFLAPWRDTRPAGATGSVSVAERMLQGRLQELERIRQDSIHELLWSVSNQWNARSSDWLDRSGLDNRVPEDELEKFQTALDAARSALDAFDAAHETDASHRQRLDNARLLNEIAGKVQVHPGFNAQLALDSLKSRASILNKSRNELASHPSAPAQARLLNTLRKELSLLQADLVALQQQPGEELPEEVLSGIGEIHQEIRATQAVLLRYAGPLASIPEEPLDLEPEEVLAAGQDQAQARSSAETGVQAQVASQAAAQRAVKPADDLQARLAELERTDPARHEKYVTLRQKLLDAERVDQWLGEQAKRVSSSPVVMQGLKNGIAQRRDLFGKQIQTLLDSESSRLDGRALLTAQNRDQVLAEDPSRFWLDESFNQFLAKTDARFLMGDQDSVAQAIDQLIAGRGRVDDARTMLNALSMAHSEWQVAQSESLPRVAQSGRSGGKPAVSIADQVLTRLGGKRVANAGGGHCLFLSFGHFRDPRAAGVGQAGAKLQQDLITSERQALLDQVMSLSDDQYRLMGTHHLSQDLDKAETVERLLIGLESGVGTDERGWGWVGHFPLKAMQSGRPVLLLAEDGQMRAWAPTGEEIKLPESARAGRSAMGQGQELLRLASNGPNNPSRAKPILVFNRHNHFEAVNLP